MKSALNIRNLDEKVLRKFNANAAMLGMTQAEYLKRLLELEKKR